MFLIRLPASALPTTVRFLPLATLAVLLGGCNMVVMNPMGDVALQQRNLVLFAMALMLLIVIPVIALVGIFAWRYRASNSAARYEPDWDHSTLLELVIWTAPLLIVICLGAVTWTGTHLLDPYRPIERLSKGHPIAPGTKPLEVQVVALDWKWLFIYPEYGIATVNELAAPVDRPIRFRLTSSSVMNAFYVPTLAGMVYAMPAMETKLHAVINRTGNYAGFSSNYSGAGFSGMRFRFYGTDNAAFAAWIARNKAAPATLSRATYLALEKPTENAPVMRFASVAPGLFNQVVSQCIAPGTTCPSTMMQDMGDETSMKHLPSMAMPKSAKPALTGGDAGEAPPKTPRDVQQRSNASPSNPTTL
jgi:cytochrome o ubiquinol oxidase subunit 2